MPAGTSTAAHAMISSEIEPLIPIFGLPDDFELHGTELLRDSRLKSYQREFFYRHCLDTIASFPLLAVATVHWDWHPALYRVSGEQKAWRHKLLWTRLLELLDEVALWGYDDRQSYDVTAITVDASTNAERLMDAHADYIRETNGTRILVNPRFEESAANRMLQATDLCAFAADLHIRPYAFEGRRQAQPPGKHAVQELGSPWYRAILTQRFPENLRDVGFRALQGPDATT